MPRSTGRGKVFTLICAECGKTYLTRGAKTRFCSNKCSGIANGRRRRTAKQTIACARCGREFLGQAVDFASRPRRRYCSSYCYGMSIRRGGQTFACERCGIVKPVRRLKSGAFWYAQRFCSTKCANDAQRTGSIHKRTGYRTLTFAGKQIPEHRIIMEHELGRPLLPDETVHHKNGDRLDNRVENLEIWSSRHGKGARVADLIDYIVEHQRLYVIKTLTRHGYTVTPS